MKLALKIAIPAILLPVVIAAITPDPTPGEMIRDIHVIYREMSRANDGHRHFIDRVLQHAGRRGK